jgi:phage protein D
MIMDTMRSYVAIHYNRSKDTAAITDGCEDYTYEDYATGQADVVNLTMDDSDRKWIGAWFPRSGDYLKCWIKTKAWESGKTNGSLFCGKFYIDECNPSGQPSRVTLSAIAVPKRSGFSKTERNRTWKKTTVKQILGDIAKRAGMKLVFDTGDHKISEESQSGQTDLEFAFLLCDSFDICLKVFNNKLVAYDQTRYEKKKAVRTIKYSDILGDYSGHAAVSKVYDGVKMQYAVGKKEAARTYEFKVPGMKGTRKMYVSDKADSLSQAEHKAKAALRKALREDFTMSFEVEGDVRYKAASTVQLKGFGKMDGKYFIDSVTHKKSRGAYTCSLTLHKVVTKF